MARAVQVLDALGIAYMITGSMASAVHGLPRTTYDADIVIDPAPEVSFRMIRSIAEERRTERQLADVRGIIDVRGRDLDRAYIEHWARELEVLDLWRDAGRVAEH